MDPLHHSHTFPEPRSGSTASLRPPINSMRSDDAQGNSATNGHGGSRSPGLSPVTSTDSRLDRLKDKLKVTGDRRDSSDGYRRRLSARIPRRKKKKDDGADGSVNTAAEDEDGTTDVTTPLQDGLESPSRADSVASSQVTTEDAEGFAAHQTPTRPSITTRPSHAGYLSLSSPLLSPERVVASPIEDSHNSQAPSGPKKAATLGAPDADKRRTSSPVGKLRDALASSRSSSKSNLKDTADPAPSKKNTTTSTAKAKAGQTVDNSAKPGLEGQNNVPKVSTAQTKTVDRARPRTPSAADTKVVPATPPQLEPRPTTLITPPTPPDNKAAYPPLPATRSINKPSSGLAWRQSTNSPGRLTGTTRAPLTPTLEEVDAPGANAKAGTLSFATGGFFSSVFSATQTAATQLTNTILNPTIITGQRARSSTNPEQTEKTGPAGGEEVISAQSAHEGDAAEGGPLQQKKQLAVETLGSGDLNFGHLGLAETPQRLGTNVKSDMASATTNGTTVRVDEVLPKAEDDASAAGRAVSAAYERSNAEKQSSNIASLSKVESRAKSPVVDLDYPASSQPQANTEEPNAIRRTGSIRSRVSERRKRRHRGSSATTGNTIAAAIGAGHAALANPQQNNGPRLTGFAVANPKRNRDFHSLFRSVPEDDYLIEDYSAALQRDILLQGRLYISEGHICFSSNILGWVTNLVISFDEVVSVEKKSTAVIFPNAIVIQTLHARNVFASLVSRDTAYDLLINIWKINHPNLKSSLNGVTLDEGTGDKTEKAGSVAASASVHEKESDEETDDDVYDEDDEEDVDESVLNGMATDARGADGENNDIERTATRKASATVATEKTAGGDAKVLDGIDAAVVGASSSADFPGPSTHAPTACGDESSHYDKPLMDTTIPAPLGKIYSLMFGPASGAFMRKWLIEDQRCGQELTLEDDKRGLDNNQRTMNFSYIKPLPGAIGPRQTKCITSYTLEQFDLEKAVTINSSTQTPDVPSGNIFLTKTRYCLMWAPGNATRLVMNCTIEWSGKSWLKGPIEKGANDGQQQYGRDLVNALKTAVTALATPKTSAKTAAGKKRKNKGQHGAQSDETPALPAPVIVKAPEPDWGLLEPIRSLLGPVGDFVSMKLVVTVLSFMVLWMWFRTPSRQTSRTPSRFRDEAYSDAALYERLWEREEDELWRWLESRVGDAAGRAGEERPGVQVQRSEGLKKREMEEAIRLTRERLAVLEEAVRRDAKEGPSEL